MSQQKQRFVELLEELFQLNQPELDFGLYRILHARSQEIRAFMNGELATEIDQAFAGQAVQSAHELLQAAKQKVLDDLADDAFDAAGELKPEYRNTKIGKDYLQAQQAAREGSGPLSDQAQVYDHLYRFFSRYYDKGDFMSKRYFVAENDQRAAPYAVPYDGREVMLHWANKDQYYIKSSEHLSNYSFDLTEALRLEAQRQGKGQELDFGGEAGLRAMKVHFRLAAATEGEHNNVKESQDRFFLIHAGEPIKFETDSQGQVELVVQFEYRPDPDKTGQANTWQQQKLAEAAQTVFQALQTAAPSEAKAEAYARGLGSLSPTEKRPDRTVLAKYMAQFADRNTMDYFIHKDLGGFLRRELDFYIKNEVMRLDDIESAQAPRVEAYLGKLRVLRKIARRVVDFLAQLEDFQKELWLKKRLVLQSKWLFSLWRLPDGLVERVISDITAPHKQPHGQISAWNLVIGRDSQLTTQSITKEFFAKHPSLMLDTSTLDEDLSDDIISAIGQINDLNESTDGVLIKSENFQGLRFITPTLASTIQAVYIDPPYNTGSDGFIYKDSFKSSSWLSMMADRLRASKASLKDSGVIFCSINEIERNSLELQMKDTFGPENFVAELVWARDTVSNNSPTYSKSHEYILVAAKNLAAIQGDKRMFRERRSGLDEVQELVAELEGKDCAVAEIEGKLAELYKAHKSAHLAEAQANGISKDEAEKTDPWKGIYPYKFAEFRDANGKLIEDAQSKPVGGKIWIFREVEPSMPSGKQSDSIKDGSSTNYRFYKPVDPKTGIQHSHPKRGWAFPYAPEPGRNSFLELLGDARIVFKKEGTIPQQKYFLHEVETVVSTSVIRQYSDGEPKLEQLFGQKGLIDNPKPPALIEKIIAQTTQSGDYAMDFFAGSGTTGQAVIDLNRKTRTKRKFVLMEMGSHFDSVLCPRIQKCILSPEWENGAPRNIESDLSSRSFTPSIIKVIELESLEDTFGSLHNPQEITTHANTPKDFQRDFLLKYWLKTEYQSFNRPLSLAGLMDPFVPARLATSSKEKRVNIMETFNWLIGLRVSMIDKPRRYSIDLTHEVDPDLPDDQGTRWKCTGIDETVTGEFTFRMIEGYVLTVPGDDLSRERVLVIWRKLTGDVGRDQAALEAWLSKMKINPRDTDFATIYVNGSHALNTDGSAGTRVCMIEETFAQRMWEDC
ncbi:site-specific DNA-methyltransferase [Aquabacterium parvum]|uniref:site-specific DNA-methyltransferase n=1 Tax=Aquabacterium parvum TaxID=70584 RepID=UPI000718DD1F|nr:site-specific DNA-methyltransferase [Aquabacterium parvum]